jgi:hypothetical protein
VFLVINTWIELGILLNLRKEIVSKRIKLSEEIRESEIKNVSKSAAVNKMNTAKQKKIDKDKKKETRAIVMVITNSCLNFVFRFPEILIFITSNSDFLYAICKANALSIDISANLVSLSYFAYTLIFTLNVVIYYIFNPKFKQFFIFWPHYVKEK